MLKDFVKAAKPEDEEFAKRLEDERAKLFAAQMKIKEAGLPVMVIFGRPCRTPACGRMRLPAPWGRR